MAQELTIAELVRNGTMSADVAATLWAAVDERVSFLTVAIPRFAGKSTTSNAVLALRPPEVPARYVEGEPEEMERLKRERLGGYLVVAEFSEAPVPGYIWGGPVRRVFEAVEAGRYSLQAALHAGSVGEAIQALTVGNGVSDEQASTFRLVLYIERFGVDPSTFWRRLAEVYEVDRVEGGRPLGRTLFRWRADGDRFEALNEPRHFARDQDDLARRIDVVSRLAAAGRTGSADVAAALAAFRVAARA